MTARHTSIASWLPLEPDVRQSSLESRARRARMFYRPIDRRLFTAAVALAVSFIPGAGYARPLVLEDYYRLVALQAPAMSPDGRMVAFIRTTIVEADNRRQNELWIVPTDGGAPPRRLSDPSVNASAPRWSPDGRLLAFTARRRGAPASDP